MAKLRRGREDDIQGMINDPARCDKLMLEYGIEDRPEKDGTP